LPRGPYLPPQRPPQLLVGDRSARAGRLRVADGPVCADSASRPRTGSLVQGDGDRPAGPGGGVRPARPRRPALLQERSGFGLLGTGWGPARISVSSPPLRLGRRCARRPTCRDNGPMDFSFSEEQLAIRDTIRELVQDKVAPRAAEIDEKAEYPRDIEKLFAENGVLAIPIPEEYGGVSGSSGTICMGTGENAKGWAPSSLILAGHALCAHPPLAARAEGQKKRGG